MTDWTDDYLKRLDGIIAERGWMNQGVMADGEATPPQPGYTYTVGFGVTLGHPEMVIFGVGHSIAAFILNDIGDRLAAGEARFDAGHTYRDVVRASDDTPLPVYLTAVPKARHRAYFGVGLRYYRDRKLGEPTWLQIVWSDARGVLPWEPGFNESMRRAQPILGATPTGAQP